MKKDARRKTNETEIEVSLEFPGIKRRIGIGCGFLAHMIDLRFSRAGIGIGLEAKGDTEVYFHHLTEEIGIVLGQMLRKSQRGASRVTAGASCQWTVLWQE